MSQQLKDDKVVIAKFGRTVGVQGQIKVYGFSEDISQLKQYQPWYKKDPSGQWHVLKCRSITLRNDCLLVHVDGIDSREAAQALTNNDIAVNASVLPSLPEGEYYWRDLIGLSVENTDGHVLGHVTDLMETGANDVLVVELADEQRLIPFLMEDVIKHIDLEKKQMLVDWDEDF